MNPNTKIDIFDMLHDGSIINAVKSIRNKVILQIRIDFLANVISPYFTSFFLHLEKCKYFAFFDYNSNKSIVNFHKISKMKPTILNSEFIDEKIIKIFCSTPNSAGGYLTIITQDIIIYSQDKNILSVEEFEHIHDLYWKR